MTNPIIFGARDKSKPFPMINFIQLGNTQLFFSRTNYNLFLQPDELDFISFGTLLDRANRPLTALSNNPFSSNIRELIFQPEICFQCSKASSGCPLTISSSHEEAINVNPEASVKWWKLRTEVEFDNVDQICPFFQNLLSLTETPAERKFLYLYLETHLRYFLHNLSSDLTDSASFFFEQAREYIFKILRSTPKDRVVGDKVAGRTGEGIPVSVAMIGGEYYDRSPLISPNAFTDSEAMRQDFEDGFKYIVAQGYRAKIGTANNLTITETYNLGEWLRRALCEVPALIPQVWMRHIHDSKMGPNDPLKEEAYSRVDFVMVWNGRRIIIEIDGPEHYAVWNRKERTWTVSEEIYTRNLQRERQLKREGWTLIRISNQEVENANRWSDIEQLIDLEELINVECHNRPDNYPDADLWGQDL